MQRKKDIREVTLKYLQHYFERNNEKKFRAKQVYEWIWKKSCRSFDEMTNLSKATRAILENEFVFRPITLDSTQYSEDGTIKAAFRLFDGNIVEGVLIPSMERYTACISTQAGCAYNCRFCATGKLKFERDLTSAEIYDQVVELNRIADNEYGGKLTNIVVMGMGEPLQNYADTLKALDIISDENGLGFSSKRITLSTVGLADEIRKLADDKVRFNLAVSLHVANDKKRSYIIPANRQNPLPKLSEALQYYNQKTGQRITFEYLMLRDFNDSIEDAKELAVFCRAFPVKINLIEYNATEGSEFQKSDSEKVDAFMEFLESKNMLVTLRQSKGNDIDAACGQLANKVSK